MKPPDKAELFDRLWLGLEEEISAMIDRGVGWKEAATDAQEHSQQANWMEGRAEQALDDAEHLLEMVHELDRKHGIRDLEVSIPEERTR